ncbi:MAG: DUF86 domain-containing protein [Luteitalea sp.]
MSSDTRRAPALSPLFVGARRWPSRPARAAWDPVRVLIVERAELRRCAERTRDISAHASFVRLAELGIVDPAFAKRIARSAGLRNRLVHDYEGIDHPKCLRRWSTPWTTSRATSSASIVTSCRRKKADRRRPAGPRLRTERASSIQAEHSPQRVDIRCDP